MNDSSKLSELRSEFLATSSKSMPIAGMIFWLIIAVLGMLLKPEQVAYAVLFGSGMIFPFGILIDRISGKKLKLANRENPVTLLFMQSLALVILMWPLVILSAMSAHNANLIVLGGAVLMGLIWIPYGWASDDPVGLQHAIGRCVLAYLAFFYLPHTYKATGISVVVCLAYLYSMIRMRKF